jgi:hypothetical protein
VSHHPILRIVLICCAVLYISMAPQINAIELAKTGRSTCYNAAGTAIPCAGTGQDGETQNGVPWPDPRFTDNGDGTVTDELTGLIWLAQADCLGRVEWLDALAAANGLAAGQCGLTDGSVAGDWRLPNVLEAVSLMNLEVANPGDWLETFGFSGFYGVALWTATNKVNPMAVPPGQGAFTFSSAQGFVGVGTKGSAYETWAVRGVSSGPAPVWRTGQSTCYDKLGAVISCAGTGQDGDHQAGVVWPVPRFTVNGDGTVMDNLTGLLWTRNLDCFGDRMWEDALADAAALADGICGLTDGSSAGDWRLPNAREILSIISHESTRPALPSGHPFTNVPPHFGAHYFWSSSSWAQIPSYAWYESLADDGQLAFGDKDSLDKVWPVRDGRVFADGFESGDLNRWSSSAGSP